MTWQLMLINPNQSQYQQAYWNKSIKKKSSQFVFLLSFCLALAISHLSRRASCRLYKANHVARYVFNKSKQSKKFEIPKRFVFISRQERPDTHKKLFLLKSTRRERERETKNKTIFLSSLHVWLSSSHALLLESSFSCD